MDQQQDNTGLSLPQPSIQGQFSAPQPIQNPTPIQQPPLPMAPAQPPAFVPVAQPAPAVPAVQIPSVPAPAPTLAEPQASTSQPELDDEALDAEWVQKARTIVEQTHNDPFTESNALSQVRADYLKRRYGKELKSS